MLGTVPTRASCWFFGSISSSSSPHLRIARAWMTVDSLSSADGKVAATILQAGIG
jgi:hypothetical protein